MPVYGREPVVVLQPLQVTANILGARQDDQVGGRDSLPRPDEPEIHLRMQAQRVKISVIADAGEHRGNDLQGALLRFHVRVRGNRILCVQVKPLQVRQYPQHRLAGLFFQPRYPRLQQCNIAAKLIDDKPCDPVPLRLTEQGKRPDQVGEHATLVNIGNQDNGAVRNFGETHVGDIPVTQVDLSRAPGALHHDIVIAALQAAIGFHDGVQQGGFSFMVC